MQKEIIKIKDEALKNLRKPFRHYPRCNRCPLSKDMSLICLDKECGDEYFQLICPYCHRYENQQHVEDDVDLVLQKIEDHTRTRLISKQVTDQDEKFIDVLLDSQKSLNKLLNKIQQVKFILDDTLNGYKSRMREFEYVIKKINNAQMSSSQPIINEQLTAIREKILYTSNKKEIDIVWYFEENYNESERNRMQGFSENCLKSIEQCGKTLKNLLLNFKDVVNPILGKRLQQKVCLEGCNEIISTLQVPWRVNFTIQIWIRSFSFQKVGEIRKSNRFINILSDIEIYCSIRKTLYIHFMDRRQHLETIVIAIIGNALKL